MNTVSYQFKKDYNEFDPEKKDNQWAHRMVGYFRDFMQPLVDRRKAAINRAYLLGTQDVEKYKKKFALPDKMPFEFGPLGVFEKTRNILTAEREKAGIYLQLNALDPTAQEAKEYDKKLLMNKAFIEELMTYAQMSIGLPPYELAKDKTLDGDKIAKGNLEAFDELGLDPNSPEDVAYFFKSHYRIDAEIEAEDVVNYFVDYHDLKEYLKEWCDDVLANKAVAGRVWADEINFTPSYSYLRPENVSWIKGQRRDGKDARAIKSEEDMTLGEFLAKVGGEVNSQNIAEIIQCVNYTNATSYDGLSFSNGTTTNVGCVNPVNYDSFLGMKISVSYIEWKSIDVDTRKTGTNSLGNFKIWQMPYQWEPTDEKPTTYKKEQIWNMVTYKCYAVAKSSADHLVFKFGKLFDQNTYGPEDEYSSYSFQVYVQNGQSAIEVAIPFIDNVHDAWFRFNWILNKAKPAGTRYNYNVIAKIASRMYKNDKEENGVMMVIKMFQDSIDDFYVNDNLNPNLGGGQNPHFPKPNGLDPAVAELYKVFRDQQDLIAEKLGINSIREAYSPNPNDGYKLQMQVLAQSRNATEYMSRMIMSLLENYAKHTVSIVQDMIAFKGKSQQFIERALGQKSISRLNVLKRVPLHKFGIFVESFNTDLERQQLKQEASEAWQKEQISYHVYILVKSIDNPKKAAQVMSYEKAKEIKRKQEEQQMLHAQKKEAIQMDHALQMERIKAEYMGKLAVQQKTNDGLIEVANITQAGDLQIKRESIASEPLKAGVRTQGKIQQDEAAARIKRGEPLETAEI